MNKKNGKYLSCSMASLQHIVAGKWKIYILWILAHQTMRFGELHRQIGGITQAMLTKQLRELEKDGFIIRHVYQEVPPKVEYSLSDLGKSFVPVLKSLNRWGETYLPNNK